MEGEFDRLIRKMEDRVQDYNERARIIESVPVLKETAKILRCKAEGLKEAIEILKNRGLV